MGAIEVVILCRRCKGEEDQAGSSRVRSHHSQLFNAMYFSSSTPHRAPLPARRGQSSAGASMRGWRGMGRRIRSRMPVSCGLFLVTVMICVDAVCVGIWVTLPRGVGEPHFETRSCLTHNRRRPPFATPRRALPGARGCAGVAGDEPRFGAGRPGGGGGPGGGRAACGRDVGQ